MSEETIHVVVSVDVSNELLEQIRDVSDKLHVTKHYPKVPDRASSQTEILYTGNQFPEPEQAPMLRWIQLMSAGMKGALERHRIVQSEDVMITSSSGIHAQQMANYCIMMLLAFHYQLPRLRQMQQAKEWRENRYDIFAPKDLHQQTVGIVGYGSIGREVARIAKTFGMNVLASKRDIRQPAENERDYTLEGIGDPSGELPERLYPSEAIAAMASECDYLVLLVPMTDETHHMINERVLNAMKPNSVIINAARGGVVDEKAMIRALQKKQIRGAALDVFEQEPLPKNSPLWEMDNVILTPHISGNSADYIEKSTKLFISNLKRYLNNRPLMNQLDRDSGY